MTTSDDAFVQFRCSGCGSILKAPRSKQGRKSPCPQCGALVTVPSADAATADSSVEQGYAIASVDRSPTEAPSEIEDERSEKSGQRVLVYSERPKLPPHPMIQGVFRFLVQPGTVMWASALSIGATVLLTLLAMALGAGRVEGVFTWISSMLLTGMLSCATLVWTVVASAFFLCILQDSAAGNEKIENWPDVVWLDWIGESLYVISSVIGSAAIGFGAAWLCGGLGPWTALFISVGVYLCFPVWLLSTLETQSPLVPVSPVILRSMFTSWTTWAVFYLESGLLGSLLLGSFWLTVAGANLVGQDESRFAVFLLALCAMAAMMVVAQLIYFQLLGRLAWVCAEKLRQLDKDEDDEDEDEDEEAPPDIRPTPVDDF